MMLYQGQIFQGWTNGCREARCVGERPSDPRFSGGHRWRSQLHVAQLSAESTHDQRPASGQYLLVQVPVYAISQSFINNRRANWPLTMSYKNLKSTIKHSDTQ